MNYQSFFDLAMKVIARQATDAERADLDALLAQEAEFRAEFARLKTDARIAKDALLFTNAYTASTGEFPAYARERLQTAVRQTLGRPKAAPRKPDRSLAWGWRWMPRLAIATAVVFLLALPVFFVRNAVHTTAKVRPTNTPLIQVAVLDTGSGTRGADTDEVATIKQTWKGISIQSFSSPSELQAWEQNWPTDRRRPAARIAYDPALGEVRVSGRSWGRVFRKTFPVESDLATTLEQAKAFIREQTKNDSVEAPGNLFKF